MTKYAWQDVDQLEDSIASSRLSAEILSAIPSLAPFSLSARKDAILAEIIGALGGVIGEGAGGNFLDMLYEARVLFGTSNAGINDADTINSPIGGIARNAVGGSAASNTIFQGPPSAVTSGKLYVRDGHRMIQPQSTTLVDGIWVWRPWANAQNPLTFNDVWPTQTGQRAGLPDAAMSIRARIRKLNAGDGSDCHFFFGFTYLRIINPSRPIARIGLLGDGVGGYRFGSVNCPDGGVSSTYNAITDIDSGFVAPPELANPGTNTFEVRIKLIPPTKDQSGRWACYLNNTLIHVFDTVANFPRGYFSGAPLDDGYRAIECGFGCYANNIGPVVAPLVGPPIVTIEEDWSV